MDRSQRLERDVSFNLGLQETEMVTIVVAEPGLADASESRMSRERASRRARLSLLGVNFFIETNRMEALVAVYLISFRGWNEVWMGYVSLVMNILMLVLQTVAGDILDKTHYKRAITMIAVVVASVTTMAVAWTSELWAVLLIKALEGIAATIFLPALMSLLLAVVPDGDVSKTVAQTETSNKIGSVLFTVCAGLISYYAYPNVQYVFYLLGGGGVAAAFFILCIPQGTIDNNRARQIEERSHASKTEGKAEDDKAVGTAERKASPSRYVDLFKDRNIVMFAVLTFLYHLSNAGVTPLVAQLIVHEDERSGLAFTSAALCIFYFVQAPTAWIVGLTYQRFGYKKLLLFGILALPCRCLTLGLLAMYGPNAYALAATQVFEGIGAGIYDTLMPLIVKRLVKGTGRFGFTFGFIVSCWRLGHGISLLLAEGILHESSYETAFFTLGGMGLLVAGLLHFGVHVPPSDDTRHPTASASKADADAGTGGAASEAAPSITSDSSASVAVPTTIAMT